MKTEKEFSDFFIASCQSQLTPEQQAFFVEKSKTYWLDLTSHLSTYFSNEDRLAITAKAAQFLDQNLQTEPLENAWVQVLRDFNTQKYWGYKTTTQKPKPVKTEEQKIFWQLFKYVWALFQSMIVLKIAVYYFGLGSAEHPDQISVFWVWLFFLISAGSLALFAYRNRHDPS